MNFKSDILIRGTCLKFDDAIVGAFSGLQVVLRGLLFVEQFGIEDVELITLYSLRRRVVLAVVHCVVFVPFDRDSPPIDILRFLITEPALRLARHPVIKRLLVFFQSLVLLKLDNLLGDKIDCPRRVVYNGRAKQIVVFGER